MHEKLTHDNFIMYCAKVYDNPGMSSSDEFFDDLNRIKYIKKLLTRYTYTGKLKERLILNHVMTLHNCFGSHLAKILYLKMENQYHMIKPFLVLINALPEKIYKVGDYDYINTDNISLEQTIVDALRKINNEEY